MGSRPLKSARHAIDLAYNETPAPLSTHCGSPRSKVKQIPHSIISLKKETGTLRILLKQVWKLPRAKPFRPQGNITKTVLWAKLGVWD